MSSSQDPPAASRLRKMLRSVWFMRIEAQHAALRQGSCFGLIDIDKFKQLDDTCGHLCGDRALLRLVRVLTGAPGSDEYAVRMGSDEFAMMLRSDQVPA